MAKTSKKRLVIANWKMYVSDLDAARQFVRTVRRKSATFKDVTAVIAAPAVFVPVLAKAVEGSSIAVGAQTSSPYSQGAHTGEVSAEMLRSAGVTYVIVGHSERRAEGENDEQIAKKLQPLEEENITAILCVGESSRDQHGTHFEVLREQLSKALARFPKSSASKLIIAYEPLWAIGKTAADAMKGPELRETVIFIRKTLSEVLSREAAMKVLVIYGGSVEPENAGALIVEGDISGFLVGHASAQVESFLQILNACRK